MSRKRKRLNEKSITLFLAIEKYWEINGYSPSIRDLIEIAGFSSTSFVKYHLDKLEESGFIIQHPKIPRSIVITRKRLRKRLANTLVTGIPEATA